ncbi:hypothetical protein PFMC_01761 [Plasmodium falciparum CAMP/Malaysia]|uniref:Uncharacterized protein n=1 Tax=Plasmodium falciparum (isolate Camp / Malaysia) TaxID=5835 RepID=A0A024XA52_PLAFC|nr:hypothetical protein PFMC_01761 [Plasmodium falciparum CAMP/Malaysia]
MSLLIQEEVENDPAEEDELNDLDNISISDLSDVDPETNNIIIGVCDKVCFEDIIFFLCAYKKVERSHHFVVLICICYIYVYFFYF